MSVQYRALLGVGLFERSRMPSTESPKSVSASTAFFELLYMLKMGSCSGDKFLEGPDLTMTVGTSKNGP